MSPSLLMVIVLGMVAGGVLLLLWMLGAIGGRVLGLLFGRRGHGPVAATVRMVVWIALLLMIGGLLVSHEDQEASRGPVALPTAASGHPIRDGCARFVRLTEQQRAVAETHRTAVSRRLAAATDPADREALAAEMVAAEQWLAWLEAADEVPGAVAAGLDAGVARAAARRAGGGLPYLEAASRHDLAWEKARRRAVLVMDRLGVRLTNGIDGDGADADATALPQEMARDFQVR